MAARTAALLFFSSRGRGQNFAKTGLWDENSWDKFGGCAAGHFHAGRFFGGLPINFFRRPLDAFLYFELKKRQSPAVLGEAQLLSDALLAAQLAPATAGAIFLHLARPRAE